LESNSGEPSKSELKKRAKAAEKEKKAAEKAAKLAEQERAKVEAEEVCPFVLHLPYSLHGSAFSEKQSSTLPWSFMADSP
jgi:hypothetical protein